MTKRRMKRSDYTQEELNRLEEMNRKYVHVTFGGTSDIYTRSHDATGQVVWECIPARQFPQRFLHKLPIKGENPGTAWLNWQGKVHKYGTCFYPSVEKMPEKFNGKLNKFVGLNVDAEEGDVSPFLTLAQKHICQEQRVTYEYLLDWLAHLIQKPEQKPSVAIILNGEQGTGKGALVEPMLRIFGSHAARTNGPALITGRFNSIVEDKLLIFMDETSVVEPAFVNRLKPFISENTLTI